MTPIAFRKLTRRLTQSLRPSSSPDPTARRDRILARRLHDRFERDLDLAGIRGLHFYVRDGQVTVYGLIRNELDRDLLRALLEHTPGVNGVTDLLDVLPDEGDIA